jgi:hypothetical protein
MGIIVKTLNTIWNFFEELAVARAAGILARQGFKKEAIALMNQR